MGIPSWGIKLIIEKRNALYIAFAFISACVYFRLIFLVLKDTQPLNCWFDFWIQLLFSRIRSWYTFYTNIHEKYNTYGCTGDECTGTGVASTTSVSSFRLSLANSEVAQPSCKYVGFFEFINNEPKVCLKPSVTSATSEIDTNMGGTALSIISRLESLVDMHTEYCKTRPLKPSGDSFGHPPNRYTTNESTVSLIYPVLCLLFVSIWWVTHNSMSGFKTNTYFDPTANLELNSQYAQNNMSHRDDNNIGGSILRYFSNNFLFLSKRKRSNVVTNINSIKSNGKNLNQSDRRVKKRTSFGKKNRNALTKTFSDE